tara:strand:- start:487 stop:807 length:321 start_codon:yes stop_codon:yes gene_type:complete
MDLDKIVDKMSKGIVLLEYTSLISGKQKQREMTLCPQFIPADKRINNSDKWSQTMNDKMICYDLEFGKWDDIDKDTIISWKEVQREKDFKKIQKELTELNHDGSED